MFGNRLEGGHVLRERGVCDFVELKAGKRAPRLEHAVCLA